MNKLILVGNLVADPAQIITSNNKTFTEFRLAVNRKFSGPNGEKVTDFFKIKAFGKVGENCQKYLAKGRKAVVVGELQARTYDDKEGVTRMSLDVIADDVVFLSSAKEEPAEEPKPKQKKITEADFTDLTTDDIPF